MLRIGSKEISAIPGFPARKGSEPAAVEAADISYSVSRTESLVRGTKVKSNLSTGNITKRIEATRPNLGRRLGPSES